MTKVLAALGIVLLTASLASADCGCAASPVVYGPTPVVVNYAPVAYTAYSSPYSYPAYGYGYRAAYAYPAPYVVARPVVAVPGPVVYGPGVVYGVPYYARPWLYVPGQPVRNALRATFR